MTTPIWGTTGADSLDAITNGNSNDTIYAWDGDDTLWGWEGDDNLYGEAGSDTLYGEAGNDFLDGYNDYAYLSPDSPNYLYDADLKNQYDSLTGGAGADTFVIGNMYGSYYQDDSPGFEYGYATIEDFDYSEGDKIQVFGSVDDYIVEDVGGDAWIYHKCNPSDLVAKVVDGAGTNLIPSLDFVSASAGDTTLNGGAYDDVLVGYGSTEYESDSLTGGAGADTFVIGDSDGCFYEGSGYATITDFDYFEGDKIQVFGSHTDYNVQDLGNDAYIYCNADTNDLVAVVNGGAGINLIPSVDFVSAAC